MRLSLAPESVTTGGGNTRELQQRRACSHQQAPAAGHFMSLTDWILNCLMTQYYWQTNCAVRVRVSEYVM